MMIIRTKDGGKVTDAGETAQREEARERPPDAESR